MKYEYWLDNTGISNAKKRMLMERFREAEEIYRQAGKNSLRTEGIEAEDIERIQSAKKNWDIEKEYECLSQKEIRLTSQYTEDYPEKLKNIHNPPFLLYYQGELPKDSFSVAVVGARRCSEYGHYMAKKLGEALGQNGIPVISGLAEGIDAAGQAGVLEKGGKTYAVLGCGTDICYPKQNQKLYEQISQHGGIIAELPPGTEPKPYYFPLRNRIISGMSDIVVVAEAKKRSGSLITADYALEQGREVYALPGRTTDALSYGCNSLIGQGAGVILSVEDFLKRLPNPRKAVPANRKKQKLCLAKEESLVYSCLSVEPKSVEKIAEETRLGISLAAGILIGLQAKGLVKESFRNYYIEK